MENRLNQTHIKSRYMLFTNKIKKYIILLLMLMVGRITAQAQIIQPTWWFGVSSAANFNFYDGSTQTLNNSLVVPTAFHKGFGIRPYGSVLLEYRPASVWGVALNVGYDGRGAKYNNVVAPCNCLATLQTNTSYVVVEPSLRYTIPQSSLYFFAGPSVAFNLTKDFTYTQVKQTDTKAEMSNMRNTLVSGQVGLGFDFKTSSATSLNQVSLSPFVSFHPYFGREPRNIESWSITTVRAGIALKFGKAHKSATIVSTPPIIAERDIVFSVRGPKAVPLKRQVSETLPLLNAIFFDEVSVSIPGRYVTLTPQQAGGFKEDVLQKETTENMTGRSARQLNVYHNVLNILGDRMRTNPGTTIALSGASAAGVADGRAYAESVKQYLVTAFGIDGSRIVTRARIKPVQPSEQPGGNKELALLRAEDTRVDIESTSPELLLEVGGGMMKPVQIMATQVDPLDSRVVFNADGAKDLLSSWSINITNDAGITQQYGPYTSDMESVPGSAILGNSPTGDYKVTLNGTTKKGAAVQKQSTIHLIRYEDKLLTGLRYSIVFGFDKAQSIQSYNAFLSGTVAPLITDGSNVIIHGHTDVIGETDYNQKLSDSRALHTKKVIEAALAKAGKGGVTYEVFGFGEDDSHSPFDNTLPEERFYNRTVIIDIIPNK
jgi:outer membrane protein OmpA-like peptidoglycan-associated protein